MKGAAHSRPRIYFFLGPSMDREEFLAQCGEQLEADVTVFPPVQQGSMLRLLDDLPDVIGIVDGYFHHVPSVLHKEILLVMQRGVRVLGAASMGALRAAELDVFGMEGVGGVYRMYRDGIIDGDDEVAVLHASEEFRFWPLSEPMVNIRHNVALAQAKHIVSARVASTVVKSAKKLPYTSRSFHAALEGARAMIGPHQEFDALNAFVNEEGRDLKRDDVCVLMNTIAARINKEEPWPETPSVTVHETKYFYRQKRDHVGHWLGGSYIPEALIVSLHKVLSPRHRGLVCNDIDSIAREKRLIREMKATGRFQSACEDAVEILKSNAEAYAANINITLSNRQIERWAAKRWDVPTSRLAATIRSRGFVSYNEFIEASKLVFIHEISRLLLVHSLPLPVNSEFLSKEAAKRRL